MLEAINFHSEAKASATLVYRPHLSCYFFQSILAAVFKLVLSVSSGVHLTNSNRVYFSHQLISKCLCSTDFGVQQTDSIVKAMHVIYHAVLANCSALWK